MLFSRHPVNMEEYYHSRKTKWNSRANGHLQKSSPPFNQFLDFCDIILKYEKYKPYEEEARDNAYSPDSDESLRANDSFSEPGSNYNSSLSGDEGKAPIRRRDEDYYLITCFCMKPYANRSMIQCSVCLTWIHFSCAKIRKNNVPDVFTCSGCKRSSSGPVLPKGRRSSSRFLQRDEPLGKPNFLHRDEPLETEQPHSLTMGSHFHELSDSLMMDRDDQPLISKSPQLLTADQPLISKSPQLLTADQPLIMECS